MLPQGIRLPVISLLPVPGQCGLLWFCIMIFLVTGSNLSIVEVDIGLMCQLWRAFFVQGVGCLRWNFIGTRGFRGSATNQQHHFVVILFHLDTFKKVRSQITFSLRSEPNHYHIRNYI